MNERYAVIERTTTKIVGSNSFLDLTETVKVLAEWKSEGDDLGNYRIAEYGTKIIVNAEEWIETQVQVG